MDFTIKKYDALLDSLIRFGFDFKTYNTFCRQPANDGRKALVLRHDVDDRKENSLQFAQIQKDKGLSGTYYFRTLPQSYDESVILRIADLGHEIGYHYETMDECRGDVDRAYELFLKNLEKFRKIVPVSTICMHGSPMSKFDNRDIWKKYSYRELGLLAEPYFDLDFNAVFYLTDTGRRWDGSKVSVRDKAMGTNPCTNPSFLKRHYHATEDIIRDLNRDDFPVRAMLTFHPQRWTDNPLQWTKELLLQNLKNQVKKIIVK